ncbi:hypothetical protein CcaCcLH18_09024 [Colletotrichum camelliae]|nr:hypothetical protein CcaCcLH18_09024 [Colletotrichum camelliae]
MKPPSEGKWSVEQQHRSPLSLWKTWYLEIMSSLLAFSCLLAIVIILFIYQGQPLPKWPEYLSINSLMAIFTAVFKASLIMPVAEGLGQLKWEWFSQPRRLADVVLFDDASRGPWGSLMLIVRQMLRLEHSYVASIGAVITVAALAIDPFSQAMIEYRACPQILGHETAETPRTNNYSAFLQRDVAEASLDPSLLVALYKGLVDPEETESLLDVKCTTGNCTFGEMGQDEYFSSLGFCHSCYDITHHVEYDESHHRYTLGSNASSGFFYHSPIGLSVQDDFRSSLEDSVLLSALERTDNQTFFEFDTLMLSCANASSTCSGRERGQPLAFRCTLAPCVERYHGEVENGKYREMKSRTTGQELKKCPQMDWRRLSENAFAAVTDSSLLNGVEQPCNPSTKSAPNSVMFNPELNISYESYYETIFNKTQWKFYPQECVWAFHMISWQGIRDVLKDLLGANLMVSRSGGGSAASTTGPLWLKRMYSDGKGNISTVEAVFRGVANSMSAAIRNNPLTNQTALAALPTEMKWASGTVKGMETCVYVEWVWIVYPAALLILQAVFSVMVLAGPRITRSRGGLRDSAWKSSPLALLFHGLDGDVRREFGNMTSVNQMNKVAQEVKVQLNRVDGVDDKGWRFCAS